MRPPGPSSTADAHAPQDTIFDDILDDPFFSGTSFPSPGIASRELEPAAPRDSKTKESTPIEISGLYAAAHHLIEVAYTSTASSSSSSASSTQSTDQERAQGTPIPKGKAVAKPNLSITIPTLTDSKPVQRTPISTTLRNVHIRPCPYPHSHPLESLRSHLVPPCYSTREGDLTRELHIAHREIRDLRAGLVKYQNSLVGARRKIKLLTETIHRDRELEYSAAAAGRGSAGW
ncbi:hypothetical protein BDW75DRAFT_237504 [Aspergillus navahoensis]